MAAFCVIAVIVLAAVGMAWLRHYVNEKYPPAVPQRMASVGVSSDIPYEVLLHKAWSDPLKYVSGYEVVQIRLEPSDWVRPEGWNDGPITVGEINERFRVSLYSGRKHLDEAALSDADWFFTESGRDTGKWADWQFTAAFYSDGLLQIYRGFDLWGDYDLWTAQ